MERFDGPRLRGLDWIGPWLSPARALHPRHGVRIAALISTGVDMYYDEDSTSVSFLSGLIVGAAIGAGLALLLAPQSGKRTRRQLLRSVEGITDGATDRLDDVSDELRSAVRTGRKKFSF
jgi:hypothetical protein